MPFTLRIGVPTDFEAAVAKRTDLPVITGERNPLFQGIYSSRIELKQRMRDTERLLTTVEKFAGLGRLARGAPDEQMTLASVGTGVVQRDARPDFWRHDRSRLCRYAASSYDFTKRLADEMIETRLGSILARIDTRGDGLSLAVFNTLGWPRTDIAQGDVGFRRTGRPGLRFVRCCGNDRSRSVARSEHFEDGGLRRVKFLFVARDIPALGHSVYHLVARKSAGEDQIERQRNQWNLHARE